MKNSNKRERPPVNLSDLVGREALTPREFAAKYGKSETWGYRQLYSGTVKAITIAGNLMIPVSEIDRLNSTAQVYSGKG